MKYFPLTIVMITCIFMLSIAACKKKEDAPQPAGQGQTQTPETWKVSYSTPSNGTKEFIAKDIAYGNNYIQFNEFQSGKQVTIYGSILIEKQ
jgi:hypothetical protein